MSRSKITSASIEDSTIAAADIASGAVEGAMATPLSHRNLIINGAMQVAQRGTNYTGYNSQGTMPTCDRWRFDVNGIGTWTIDQSTDAPDGFSNSFKITCTTANSSPSADQYILHRYKIEAQDLQQLGYGTSDAKDMTMSFWVKSNKTGVGTVEFQQEDNSSVRHNQNFTISSADTWEKKTIVIPGDTSGNIDDDNAAGLQIIWWITSGSTWTTGTLSSGGWASIGSDDRNAGGTLTVGTATSDYFNITGVQLEVGSVATPFEHRSYGEELARCQRYYQASDGTHSSRLGMHDQYVHNGTQYGMAFFWKVTMRTTPTVTIGSYSTTSKFTAGNYFLSQTGPNGTRMFNTATSDGQGYFIYDFEADAEL